jgi:hypothetical protein
VAVASIVIAGCYLVAAALAALGGMADPGAATPGNAMTAWLPIHLALAGGASTAIAGVMPFFMAALAAGLPAETRLRAGAVALVATGAALVAVRAVVPDLTVLPLLGGLVYLAGIAATAAALGRSGRRGLAVRRPMIRIGYQAALLNVAVGAILATLLVAGWEPVLERWPALRPAHAWTNLVGFVSVVIVTTLVHFLPTVLGTRIVPRGSATTAVIGLGGGSPFVAAGLAADSVPLVAVGLVLTLAGTGALLVEAARVYRARGRWTTDAGWHLVTGGGLLAGICWFAAGIALATVRVVASGPGPEAWSSALVAVPLAVGWVTQVLVASWTHLLPAIGPGGPVAHARQRVILGRAAAARLLLLNAGAATATVGLVAGAGPVAGVGLALVALAIGWSVAIAGRALLVVARPAAAG